MTRLPRNVVVFLLVLLVVIALAVLPELRHSPPTLLQRATRLASIGDWFPARCNYYWEAERSILIIRQDGWLSGASQNPVYAARINLLTKQISTISSLETALQTHSSLADVSEWQLSPDGKWLLCQQSSVSNQPGWVVTALDGTRQFSLPWQNDEEYIGQENAPPVGSSWKDANLSLRHTFWSQDSRFVLTLAPFSSNDDTALYRINPSTAKTVKTELDFMTYDRIVLGLVGPNHVLTVYNHTGDGGGIGFADFPTDRSGPVNIYYRHIPPNMDVREVALSPDKTRLAWKFAVKPLPFGLEATRNSNYVRHSQPATVGLWVSNLDCSGLREIGILDARDDSLSNLRWTPDGKRLSFVDKDALYTVPAD